MDYKEKYEQGLECLEEILNSGQEKIKITLLKERLLPFFPELESEDERIRKELYDFVYITTFQPKDLKKKERFLAWLEKQKITDKEIVFRPLAGTDIIAAANQALEKIEIGKEVILAFNGAYIPVNGKTVAEICNEYFSWTEKQGEKKVPSVDFKAKDCYVSKVDGNIHDMTYNPVSNSEIVEYVYILDYASGRVIVTKHDVEENFETLFEKLGLKENQCHYMTSSDILSIEYINF